MSFLPSVVERFGDADLRVTGSLGWRLTVRD
jgi:hypothetical protein